MSRYYLHLRDGTSEILDPDGAEFATMDALRLAVLTASREIIAHSVRNGVMDLRFRLDAEDEHDKVVYSLPFSGAMSIIPPEPA